MMTKRDWKENKEKTPRLEKHSSLMYERVREVKKKVPWPRKRENNSLSSACSAGSALWLAMYNMVA